MIMKTTKTIRLARSIRDAIERDGRSLYAISKASGVVYQALHPFARGHRDDISLLTADRLCKALHLELRPIKGKGR